MRDMPRKLPPFVTKELTRHEKWVYYFRRGKGPRTRLPAIDHQDFDEAYEATLAGSPRRTKRVANTKSLEWLVTRYRETSTYRGLSAATRKQRDNILKHVLEKSGDKENDILKWTHQYELFIENVIRENPAPWMCGHRRWKTRPPEEKEIRIY